MHRRANREQARPVEFRLKHRPPSYEAQGADVVFLGVDYLALRAAADRFASWSM